MCERKRVINVEIQNCRREIERERDRKIRKISRSEESNNDRLNDD